MKKPGVIQRTCAILASLMQGVIYNRHTLAEDFGIGLAAADRFIDELERVPGVVVRKHPAGSAQARQRTIEFRFSEALLRRGVR